MGNDKGTKHDADDALIYDEVFDEEGEEDADELFESSYTSDSEDDPLGCLCDVPEEEAKRYRAALKK